jgi:two-component system, HptB-dependent secretion and biofilm response regulator
MGFNMRSILIIDDDPISQLHAKQFLKHEGFNVLSAKNGRDGIEMFRANHPDLVLMDVMMPKMDGYEAARAIKAYIGVDYLVPIIFLTGVSDKVRLAECLNCGGDDFLTKPFDNTIMKARINAWLRKVELTEKIAHDRESIENIILKMREDPDFNNSGLRMLMTPLEKTNGDIVLSAFQNENMHQVLVGDFTGHGLSAAVCGPMVSDIFYSMSKLGFSSQDILTQINRKLYKKLPDDMFLTVSFLEIKRNEGRLKIWNCGMPDVLLFREGTLYQKFPSSHLPLGIRKEVNIDEIEAEVQIELNDLIYALSDGIVETLSSSKVLFGIGNLVAALEKIIVDDDSLEALHRDLNSFRGSKSPTDDITIVEIKNDNSNVLG